MHISQYEQVLRGLRRTICRVMTQDSFESRPDQFENKIITMAQKY